MRGIVLDVFWQYVNGVGETWKKTNENKQTNKQKSIKKFPISTSCSLKCRTKTRFK